MKSLEDKELTTNFGMISIKKEIVEIPTVTLNDEQGSAEEAKAF